MLETIDIIHGGVIKYFLKQGVISFEDLTINNVDQLFSYEVFILNEDTQNISLLQKCSERLTEENYYKDIISKEKFMRIIEEAARQYVIVIKTNWMLNILSRFLEKSIYLWYNLTTIWKGGCDVKKSNYFSDTIELIVSALKERGYDPYAQLIGYLKEGNIAYITSHKDARLLVTTLDKEDIARYLKNIIISNKATQNVLPFFQTYN